MKQLCEVVRDLLWQYEEGECSAGTRAFMKMHLDECESCRTYREALRKTEEEALPPVAEPPVEQAVLRRGFRKIKRRWLLSLLAIVMIVPLIFLGTMISHEINKEGLCFSNWQEIRLCRRFVRYLETGKYEKAAAMLDFAADYADIREAEANRYVTYYDTAILTDLGDERVAVTPQFASYHGISADGKLLDPYDEENFWFGILYNTPTEAFIPEDIWERLVDMARVDHWNGREVFVPHRIRGEAIPFEIAFIRIETAWGNYYTTDTSLAEEEVSPADFVHRSGLVTEEIYEAAREEVMKDTEESARSFYEYYQDVLAMTEEEYVAAQREDFVRRMTYYRESGYTLSSRGFRDAYRCDDHWQIEFDVTETKGEKIYATLAFSVENGKLNSYIGGNALLFLHELLGRVEFEG